MSSGTGPAVVDPTLRQLLWSWRGPVCTTDQTPRMLSVVEQSNTQKGRLTPQNFLTSLEQLRRGQEFQKESDIISLKGRRIKPQEFEDFFDPRELRKETCLLYEISWGRRHNIWRHTGLNTEKHVEINFIEKITSERFFRPSTRCSITWFLSWSPCGECSKAITEFLSQHPNVTLFIYVARLYYHTDPGNRQGLRDLVCRGVTVQIMTEKEYCYCWKNFVNYPPSNKVYWPRYPNMWMRLYILELLCIILGLPPCLRILRRNQHEPPLFKLTPQRCHYERIPPPFAAIFWATGLMWPGSWR